MGRIIPSACQNVGLDDTLGLIQILQELLQGGGHLRSFRTDGHQRAGVGGDGLVDGQDVGVVPCEAAQNGTEHTGLVVEHQMEGDDPTDHQDERLEKEAPPYHCIFYFHGIQPGRMPDSDWRSAASHGIYERCSVLLELEIVPDDAV